MKTENGNLCYFLSALAQAYNYPVRSSQEPSWPWFDVEMTSTDKALLLKAQPIVSQRLLYSLFSPLGTYHGLLCTLQMHILTRLQ